MNEQEISYGFRPEDTEEEIRKKYGDEAAQLFIEQQRKTADWNQKDRSDFNAQNKKLYTRFAQAIDKGLQPASPEIQQLVKEHRNLIGNIFHPSRLFNRALANLYLKHPGFRKFFVQYHDDLPEFLVEAMNLYADAGADLG